jgi:hypothetical protein
MATFLAENFLGNFFGIGVSELLNFPELFRGLWETFIA